MGKYLIGDVVRSHTYIKVTFMYKDSVWCLKTITTRA